ncbi:MAG: sulfite exporter TauE/SafE family protein [Melioribacteraceae bacterium]|nr:sulfite exporter TauE/SafE family protein [Melioribacteraceae bacterium]
MEVWTGLIIGLVGSLHCIGMCGPIAIALPVYSESGLIIFIGRIIYNLGRVISYTIIGLIFGLLGKSISIIGLQQGASIAVGVIILLSVLLPQKIKNKFIELPPFSLITKKIKYGFSKLANKGSNSSMLLIGIINGFLPCGFVYVGVAGALTMGSILDGMIYMILFGLGTVPIMLFTSMAGKFFTPKVRSKISKAIPVLAVILAIVFILRGLNLGIPFVSPKNPETKMNTTQMIEPAIEHNCCK